MSHRLVAAAAAALCATACTKNFDGQISCSSDYNCPTAYHCASDGKCHSGEATVQVSWVSPADGAAVSAAPTVSVHVGHPDGISSVSILSGTTVVGTKAGNVATTAPAQVDVQVDMSAIPEGNATLTATATSTKGATGSAPQRTFLVDKHENTPTLVSFTPASPNNAALTTFTVKGAADLGPSATTVYLFTDSTCGGGNVANAVFSGSATSLIEPGFQVPVIPNSDTTYYAMSVDSAGNASPCSSTLTTNGSINFVNAQMCVSVTPAVQVFSGGLGGCAGTALFGNRGTLCAAGCRPATADEWVANNGGKAPTHHYWTDDALNFSTGTGPCSGTVGCNTGICFATRGTAAASNSCALASPSAPMHVCAGSGASGVTDPEGNVCNWTACGYNSVAPQQFFGGCAGNTTAGALCICGVTQWFVSATGSDSNTGKTAASAFRTITKALSVARSGDTVFVSPGTYNATNGETFPLHVPSGVVLIGDEPNRGAGGTPTSIVGAGPTAAGSLVSTAIMPAAGSTVAGFTIASTVTSNFAMGLVPAGNGVVIRNNTIAGSTNAGVYVAGGTTNHTILLNAINSNGGVGLGYIGTSAGGKAENNTITGNKFGVEYDSPGGDMGGGPAGSVGNNVLSCNTANDVWTNQSITISLANSKLDHVPPLTGCVAGNDLCSAGGATATFLTTNPSLATGSCP